MCHITAVENVPGTTNQLLYAFYTTTINRFNTQLHPYNPQILKYPILRQES